jgi:hypothetical protein
VEWNDNRLYRHAIGSLKEKLLKSVAWRSEVLFQDQGGEIRDVLREAFCQVALAHDGLSYALTATNHGTGPPAGDII